MRRDLAFVLSVIALAWFVSAEGYPGGQSAEQRAQRANAQTQAESSSAGPAASAKIAASAAVPEPLASAPIEMKRLAWLVGKWKTEEKYEPGLLASAGGVGYGTETVKIGPGGLSLLSDYEGQGPRGAITGHGVIAYDRETDGYKISWSDNRNPSGSRLNGTGDWESETLVFKGTMELNGRELAMKQLFYNIGPDSFTAVLYSGEKPTKLEPILIIDYAKVQPAKGDKP
jgi:uncharacterized protein DUF1579